MKKKYIFLMIVFLLLFIGASYALWVQDLYQTDENLMATSCFNITMEQANTIEIQNAYPITDEAGRKLTPYTFIIKNNCEAYASYQVNLEVLNTSTLTNLEFVKVMFDTEAPVILSSKDEVTKTIDTATTSKLLFKGGLDVNESKTHSLRLWIDENVTTEDNVQNTKFVAQIGLTAAYTEKQIKGYDLCIEKYGEESIQCQILLAETDASLCPTVNADGTVNVNSIEDTNSLLCSAPDDYGNSYYFRGVPENNWVKFGGYYWRIIRINGDDSIRMIYAGDASVIDALDEETKTTVLKNGYDDSVTLYTQIGTSWYNNYWKTNNVQETLNSYVYGDNAGVGYMYGNRNGIVTTNYTVRSSTVENTALWYVSKKYAFSEETRRFYLVNPIAVIASELNNYIDYYTFESNLSSSSDNDMRLIRKVTYEENNVLIDFSDVRYGTTSIAHAQTNTNDSDMKIYLDEWYKHNLVDYEPFISDTLFCNDRTIKETIPDGFTNLGYGAKQTAYRWYTGNNIIKLSCQQQNDLFTVNDEVVGNGDLTYPIGLLTADEVYITGGSRTNTSFYLYTGYKYWTMTPIQLIPKATSLRVTSHNGTPNDYYSTFMKVSVRPIINLKPNTLKSGDGTASNPYKIEA